MDCETSALEPGVGQSRRVVGKGVGSLKRVGQETVWCPFRSLPINVHEQGDIRGTGSEVGPGLGHLDSVPGHTP